MRASVGCAGADPALLKAIVLIFIELMLVTAIALFFSTFSSPMLSAALTFGLFIAGHFNADLKNFDQVVDSQAGGVARARRSYYVLPNLSAFDVKTEVVHGLPVRPGYHRCRRWLRRALHRGAADRCDADLLAAGLQVTARSRRDRRGAGAAPALWPAQLRCRWCGTGRIHATQDGDGPTAVRAFAGGAEAVGLRLRCAGSPMSTGSARSSITAAIGSPRPTALAASTSCSTRCSTSTTTLDPYFNIAYRFGAIFLANRIPAGPDGPIRRWRCCARASPRCRDKWQYYHDIGFVYYWRLHDYKAAREWFQRAAAQPGCAELAAPLAAVDARRAATTGRRRAFCGSRCCNRRNRWLRRTAERRLLQLDALDEIDQLQAVVRAFRRPTADATPGGARSAAVLLRGVPVDPTGTPYALDPSTGRVSVSAASRRCSRCQPSRGRRVTSSMPCTLAVLVAVSACRRQLPQRLHPSPAARPVARASRVPLPGLRLRAAMVRQHSACRATRCSAAAAASAATRISIRYPVARARHAQRSSSLHGAGVRMDRSARRPRLVFACAMIVLFAIDLEHHLLPNAITLPGIVVGLRRQPGPSARASSTPLLGIARRRRRPLG